MQSSKSQGLQPQNLSGVPQCLLVDTVNRILALEDGGYVKKIDDLIYLSKRGIKIICLTWNYKNTLGYPHTTNLGLTNFGKDVVKKMEELRMIVCVSHLSDKGFYDVYNNTTKPFFSAAEKHPCGHTVIFQIKAENSPLC